MSHTQQPALSGVIPPLVTPFTAQGELDVPSLERHIERLIDAGVHGVFTLGSSGEVVFHTDERRDQILGEVTRIVDGRVPVLAGVIDTQTDRVIDHIREAEQFDLAGYVATAPFYAVNGPEEVNQHFRSIAASTGRPIWAYDIPLCVHTKLAPEFSVQLGRDGVIAGVKDSSNDDINFRRLALLNEDAGSPLTLLSGHEVVVDGAYLSGASGVIPGLGNVDPAGYVRMHEAATAGDWKTVRAEQNRLARLFEMVFQPIGKVGPAAGVGAFKTALRELGVFETNTMAQPMSALDDETAAKIRTLLEQAGLL